MDHVFNSTRLILFTLTAFSGLVICEADIAEINSVIAGELTDLGTGSYASDWFYTFNASFWPVIIHDYFGTIEVAEATGNWPNPEPDVIPPDAMVITDSVLGLLYVEPSNWNELGTDLWVYSNDSSNYLYVQFDNFGETEFRWVYNYATADWQQVPFSDVSINPPLWISITSAGGEALSIEFTGILQSSSTLGGWTDLDPQPSSPYIWTPEFPDSRLFFRVRD